MMGCEDDPLEPRKPVKRDAQMDLAYLSEITDAVPRATKDPWRHSLRRYVHRFVGFDLRFETGEVCSEHNVVGWYRFLSDNAVLANARRTEAAAATTGSQSNDARPPPWFPAPPVHPGCGRRLGWLGWWIGSSDEDARHFGISMAEVNRAAVVDLRLDIGLRAMCEQVFSLDNVIDKHGFGDGDLFVKGDAEYTRYVYTTLSAALRRVGIRERLTSPEHFGTAHNPYRLLHSGKAARRLLGGTHVSLWVYSRALFDAVRFFRS